MRYNWKPIFIVMINIIILMSGCSAQRYGLGYELQEETVRREIEMSSEAVDPAKITVDEILTSSLFIKVAEQIFGKSAADITWSQLQQVSYLEISLSKLNLQDVVITYMLNQGAPTPKNIWSVKGRATQYEPNHSNQAPPDTYADCQVIEIPAAVRTRGDDEIGDLGYFTGLNSLVLGAEIKLKSVQKDLGTLTQLRCLSISHISFAEIRQLFPAGAPITDLIISYADEGSIGEIEQFTQLKSLSMNRCKVSSLDGLESFQNLRLLELNECSVTDDMSALSRSKSLEALFVKGKNYSQIDYLSEIKDLKRLKSLHLNDSDIWSLSPLMENTSLTELSLHKCENLRDITAIETMTNLKTFYIIMSGKMAKLDFNKIPQLTDLYISVSGGVQFDDLAGLTNLELLTFFNFDTATDLQILTEFHSLRYLQISQVRYNDDLSPILNLPKLENIYLNNSQFLLNDGKLLPNENLIVLSLENAEINGSKAGEFSFLSNYPNLRYLSLAGINLSSLEFIDNLPVLKEFHLQRDLELDYGMLDQQEDLQYFLR